MVDDIEFFQDECAVPSELPPPYTVFDDRDGETDSSSPQTLHPTDMAMDYNGGIIIAQQLLQPKQTSVKIQFEGLCKTIMTIRQDVDNKYQGLISVCADFEHWNDNAFQQSSPVNCISEVEQKSGQLQITFGLSAPAGDICKNVYCVCEVVIPVGAAVSEEDIVSELIVRMPRNSQLLVRDITSGALGRLDIAVIHGSADIRSVSVSSMRVAMGDGAICARNISAVKDAEFVSIRGTIELRNCTVAKTLSTKTKYADIDIHKVKAPRVDIEGGTRPTKAGLIEADSFRVHSNSGSVTIECSVADLKIATRSGPIHGIWNVSRSIDIYAASAIIKGACGIQGDCVRASVMSRDWPISLAIDEGYAGHYDVRARNSVVGFGLPRGTRYEDHPHWCQGVIGVSGNVLSIEGVNAPVVVSSSAL